MWNERRVEKLLKTKLKDELTTDLAQELIVNYESARTKLLGNILGQIPAAEPDLSDHGPDHIANVLDNVSFLLKNPTELSALDLYILLMAVLFHDVGNLYGRAEHNEKIAKVYSWARGNDAVVRREKNLVLKVAGAHTGKASDGSKDTLKDISEKDHFHGETVRLRDIAAFLRFSDELAEGPQRTSEFRRREGMYSENSVIYHLYGSITYVTADRGTERIRLSYEIELTDLMGEEGDQLEVGLRELLEFIYERAVKLDQERRYARYYCDELSVFRATEVSFNFHFNEAILFVSDIPPIRIDDKVVPGDAAKGLPDYNSNYELDTIVAAVSLATQSQAS